LNNVAKNPDELSSLSASGAEELGDGIGAGVNRTWGSNRMRRLLAAIIYKKLYAKISRF